MLEGSADAAGVAAGSWTPDTVGSYLLNAAVVDPDGNGGEDEVALEVVDPGSLDGDLDGWTGDQGDCDDDDPTAYPGAPELADGIDNDCNGVVEQ